MADSLVKSILDAEAEKLDAAKKRYPQLLDITESTPKLKDVLATLGKSLKDVATDSRVRRDAAEQLRLLEMATGLDAKFARLQKTFEASTAARTKWLVDWEVSRLPLVSEEMNPTTDSRQCPRGRVAAQAAQNRPSRPVARCRSQWRDPFAQIRSRITHKIDLGEVRGTVIRPEDVRELARRKLDAVAARELCGLAKLDNEGGLRLVETTLKHAKRHGGQRATG